MFSKSKLWLPCLAGWMLAGGATNSQAQLAAKKAEEWVATLEGPQRIATQKIDAVLSKLALKPGMIVADIGAGSGLFARPLAKAVAPGGKIYAVDIQQDLLDHINQRDKEENIGNTRPSWANMTILSCRRATSTWHSLMTCSTISSTARFI